MSSVIRDNWSVKSQEEISLDLPFRCDSLVHVKKKKLNLVRLFHLIAKFSYELKSEFNDGNKTGWRLSPIRVYNHTSVVFTLLQLSFVSHASSEVDLGHVHTNQHIFETSFYLSGFVWTGLKPLWRAVSKQCGFGDRIDRFRVNGAPIRGK